MSGVALLAWYYKLSSKRKKDQHTLTNDDVQNSTEDKAAGERNCDALQQTKKGNKQARLDGSTEVASRGR